MSAHDEKTTARGSRFRADQLDLELTVRSMRGPLIAERHPWPWFQWVLAAPAVALLLGLLLLPTLWTVVRTLGAHPQAPVFVACATLFLVASAVLIRYHERDSRAERPGALALALDEDIAAKAMYAARDAAAVRWAMRVALSAIAVDIGGRWLPGMIDGISAYGWQAYLVTFAWVGFALVLVFAGLGVAWITRTINWRALWLPLVLPAGVSALVSGVAFRLIFDINGLAGRPILGVLEFFGLSGVDPYVVLFSVVLFSAFLWTWLGFIVSLFRAGIDAILADPARHGYLNPEGDSAKQSKTNKGGHEGLWVRLKRLPAQLKTWSKWWGRLLDLLSPLLLIVGITVGVAAARVFDVVLIAVPGALQYELNTVSVHWWRLAIDSERRAEAAAFALPFALLVGAYAWIFHRGNRRHRHGIGRPPRSRPHEQETGKRSIGTLGKVVASLILALWLIPLIVLVVRAGIGPGGLTTESIRILVANDELWGALGTTGWVAAVTTVIVVTVAVPVAYLLAAEPSGSWRSRVVVGFLVFFAVMPVQLYLGVLHDLAVNISSTRVPLIIVHTATGLPTAILILRGALLAPKDSATADALFGLTSAETTVRRVLASAGPALGAVAVLEFVQVWNDFVISLLISGAGASPLSTLLWGEARQLGLSADELAAGAVVFAVPPVLLLLACWHRWVVRGLTGGVLR